MHTTVPMPCTCSQYPHLELRREDIGSRIRESPDIRQELTLIAEQRELRLALYRCPGCGELWQSGHEWNFGDREYLFRVPEIDVASWQEEPYMQPAAMLLYSAMMDDFLAQCQFQSSDNPCKIDSCREKAIQLSVFCLDHHIQALQQRGRLPQSPSGRLFPPTILRTRNPAVELYPTPSGVGIRGAQHSPRPFRAFCVGRGKAVNGLRRWWVAASIPTLKGWATYLDILPLPG